MNFGNSGTNLRWDCACIMWCNVMFVLSIDSQKYRLDWFVDNICIAFIGFVGGLIVFWVSFVQCGQVWSDGSIAFGEIVVWYDGNFGLTLEGLMWICNICSTSHACSSNYIISRPSLSDTRFPLYNVIPEADDGAFVYILAKASGKRNKYTIFICRHVNYIMDSLITPQ